MRARAIIGTVACCAMIGAKAQDSLLTLDHAVELVLKNNFDIRIARNTAEQAANDNTIGNAGMLPRVDLNGAYATTTGHARQELSNNTEVDRTGATSDNLSGNVALSWTVFDGLGMFATKKRLEELTTEGELALKVRIEEVLSGLIGTYYTVVQQQQALEAINEQIAVAEEVGTIAQRRLDNGSGSKLDVLLARTQLNAQRSAALSAQAGLDNAKLELCRLLTIAPTTTIAVEDTVIIRYDPDLAALQNAATAGNNTLLLSGSRQRAAELGLRATQATRWPTIDLNGAYQFTRSTNNASFILLNQNLGYTWGVTASVPLFNGLRTNTAIRNAKLDLLNAGLDLESERQQLDADTRKAWRDLQSRKGILTLEEENITAAREVLHIAEARFQAGLSSIVELKEAQSTFAEAASRLVTARYNAKVAETELRRLAGDLVH
ncbi:MAG: TolC family protein [Flavobacteriales bacterium]|nr:TolC family protein [Flavobacteriales bacterium]